MTIKFKKEFILSRLKENYNDLRQAREKDFQERLQIWLGEEQHWVQVKKPQLVKELQYLYDAVSNGKRLRRSDLESLQKFIWNYGDKPELVDSNRELEYLSAIELIQALPNTELTQTDLKNIGFNNRLLWRIV